MSTFYVDRGMAWCTVAGGFVANFLLGGLAKSYGLIMEAFQEEFQSGAAYLLLAGGLIYTLMYCLSLVNHYISQRYGSRPVVVVGALGSCISLLVAAFSPHIALWVVAVGVGVGASLSCIYFTVFSVVGRCFRRHLGLANGISVAGVSVGQMAFPSLITYLNEVYGTRGGTVVMSAVCLHLLITAAFMPRYVVDPDDVGADALANNVKKKNVKSTDSARRRRLQFLRRRKMPPSPDSVELTANSTLVSMDTAGLDAKKGEEFEHLYTEVMDQGCRAMGDQPDGESPSLTTETKDPSANGHIGSTVSLERKKHQNRLSNALLTVYIVAKIFGDIGDVNVSFVAPPHGSALGFSPVMVSRAIAVAGGVDLIARLGVGWLTDRPGCAGKRGILLASIWIVTGINALAFAQLSRLKPADSSAEPSLELTIGYFICFGVHGVCSGTAMTQMVVVLSDWVGSSRLAHSLALTMVVLGLLMSPSQFAIGYVADITHSYVWPLRLCFLILLTAGGCLLMEFPVRWFYSRRSAQYTSVVKINGHSNSNTHLIRPMKDLDMRQTDYIRGPCWEIIDSDSEMEIEPTTTCVQPGIGPVPAHPALSAASSIDLHCAAPFVCSQEPSLEKANELNSF